MKSGKAIRVIGILCGVLGVTAAEPRTKTHHALGKAIRTRIGKSIDSSNARFVQHSHKNPGFFGDLAAGALTGIASQAFRMPVGGVTPSLAPVAPAVPPPQDTEISPNSAAPTVDLEKTAETQQLIEEQLDAASKEGDKLEEAVDMLQQSTGANDRKGVDYSVHVMNPKTSAQLKEEKSMEIAEVKAAPPPIYTAPVIVLLPPEPTPVEKLEFARAIACRGRMNTPEMQAARTAELAEMSTISGHTVSALQAEQKQTEALLEKTKAERQKLHEELRQIESNTAAGAKSQADVIFLKDDLKLVDEKIALLLDKLLRIETRVVKLKKSQKATESKFQSQEE